jgi:hypothetical protein
MSVIIDREPPPQAPLAKLVEGLQPGESLFTLSHNLRVVRTTTTRVKKAHPDRQFRSAETDGGARVWRTK